MKANKAPEFLRYAGGLGHTWVTTYLSQSGERLYSECGSGPRAYETWKDCGENGGRIFTRTRRGWKEVRPTLAAIS